MEPHQERVLVERAELADKTKKLGDFFKGEIFKSLDEEEKIRLIKQHVYMGAYLAILDERIAHF